jgi:hypothetical protein
MGYYISSMIGIRTGGVFCGDIDIDDLTSRVGKVLRKMVEDNVMIDIDPDDPSHCMSKELSAHKGSYVVIAGVFNGWSYEYISTFAARLSTEFRTEVMAMTWDEEQDIIQCNVFLRGVSQFEVNENPIGQILRRVGA